VGPIEAQERAAIIRSSAVAGVYDKVEDRESAYERLSQRVNDGTASTTRSAPPKAAADGGSLEKTYQFFKPAIQSAMRAIGTMAARELVRGVLGSVGRGERSSGSPKSRRR
jgi:hypothetical protein